MSNANEIDDPAQPSGGVDWGALQNRLLLFDVIDIEKEISTVHGVKDAVRADLAVLDGPEAGKRYDNTLVFPGVLISQLKSKVGKKVLGRLGTGEKKQGQNAPWKLITATDQDKQLGQRYLASLAAKSMEAPADPWASAPQGKEPPF
jgi:hypothetical protein